MNQETLLLAGADAGAPRGLGRRHLQVLLLFLAIATAYGIRINLSVALVSMTNQERKDGYPVYQWDQKQFGTVQSSFFWGYTLMQVPGSMLVQRFGPRRFLLAAMAGASVLAVLTPLAVRLGGMALLITTRVCQGLLSGLVFPSSHNILGRWAPPMERPRFTAFVYGGMSLGTVAAMGGAGLLCGSPLGWPSAFYVPGALGLSWCVLWYLFSADTPAQCKGIAAEELAYIQRSIGSATTSSKAVSKVPWKAILTSPPALSLLVVHCGQNFGHWMLLTEMPNFMKTKLHFNIKEDGLFSALPYVSLWAATFLVGWSAQKINERRVLPLAVSRKVFNSVAHWGSGLTLLLLALLQPGRSGAVALLTVAITLESCIFAGFYVSHMDLSPNYGGALMGLSNGCGSVMGILAPLIVGLILEDEHNPSEEKLASMWSWIFILTACIYFAGNLVYVLLCRATVQPWNEPQTPADEKGTGLVTLPVSDPAAGEESKSEAYSKSSKSQA
ncbi:putative inorganic phosphate cotransporter [Thrips palmi]|uniref:Putative inorganic phosphate cotransporter n=1 Tax=Thrips palmi TaxID=161013 RepID=A0A6P8YJV5_THRPL|nr:putative inorganic phosphate cotransporter [Thrips palmi]